MNTHSAHSRGRLARVRSLLRPVRRFADFARLPAAARAEYWADRRGLWERDAGIEPSVRHAVRWLCRAQDRSASADGGVARHYSLLSGWGESYPETTGYIVPTLLDAAGRSPALERELGLRDRARRMLDWLTSIQLADGSFLGGTVGSSSRAPVTFNTGQILLGLAAGVVAFDEPERAMRRAADWLVTTQDTDGCWRRFPTPFARRGEKTYETHVARALFEVARLVPDGPYGEAALASVRWALGRQRENGWLADCCLTDPARPLTHTLGYALRGFVEAYRFSLDEPLLRAACKTADGLLSALRADGFLPGRLLPDWRPAVSWSCLTGSLQIAESWLLLSELSGRRDYREAAAAANRYVRRTVKLDADPDVSGGVKGSFPVSGGYGRYEYLSWGCKFFIDANTLERTLRTAPLATALAR